jgi:hypothetical protein
MGTLRDLRTTRELRVRGRILIGRSARADVALTAQAASSEHASISWDGQEWLLRDLKSRNGTWINDTPLTGRTWRLATGDEITFGDPEERWSWVEGSPPRAAAARSDGSRVEATHQLFWLPDAERGEVVIYQSEQSWLLEQAGQTRAVQTGETVLVAGENFVLDLPEAEPSQSRTHTLAQTGDIRTARAVFTVSLDEEHVELTVEAIAGSRTLASHSFHYMLLLLARARVADARAGVQSEDAGWVYVEELAKQLTTDAMKLNVDICRARKLIDELAWFANPEELIQRRKTSKQLRLGCGHIDIRSASMSDASKPAPNKTVRKR